jgi:hypothetical protein
MNTPGPFTAWQMIGWEGNCGTFRIVGGRAIYTDIMYNCATARSDNVKLCRLGNEQGIGINEVKQYVDADTKIEILSITRAGWLFLQFQELVTDVPEALIDVYRNRPAGKPDEPTKIGGNPVMVAQRPI